MSAIGDTLVEAQKSEEKREGRRSILKTNGTQNRKKNGLVAPARYRNITGDRPCAPQFLLLTDKTSR